MGLEDDGADFIELYLACIPVAGFAGFMTGVIDLNYDHSRQTGRDKILAFLISHTLYLLGLMAMAVLL